MFFAETQNKLLYAVTHQTAAEIIVGRADAAQWRFMNNSTNAANKLMPNLPTNWMTRN